MLVRQDPEHCAPFSHLMRDIKIGDSPKNEQTGGNIAKWLRPPTSESDGLVQVQALTCVV